MSDLGILYPESKYRDQLYFTDTPPGIATYFEQPFEGYALECRIVSNNANEKPWVLSVHGARGDFTKSDAVTFGLQKRGYSVLGMNMSGHSKAGVLSPEETTLGNNLHEVEAFYQCLDKSRKKVVIAYSLGGTPALKLLEKHAEDIDKLVLFYRGIYAKDAYDKHYGEEFRSVIAEPYGYQRNDVIDLLASFKGEMLLIKGQYDGLDPLAYGKPAGTSAGEVEVNGETYYSPIPKEVIDEVYAALPDTRKQLIVVPDCGHSVILWMRSHATEAEALLDQIDAFLRR